ncbi:hypothetical protein OG730_15825 [Streptomyces sp. NBC_01298]|uniref:hypothetical protein n=1 Tax=Streptomyces sp. NBC_01298 TaxID=2903817 RepID=UPI002E0D607C|nr:hypothetical protein OG730_15825 [Streptomyces sp. NBC_01298]
MRSNSLPKSLLLAVLGCVVLAGCGTRNAATDQALAGGVVPAASASASASAPEAAPSDEEFLRFLELMNDMPSSCLQEVADEKGVSVEELEELNARRIPPEELLGREDTPGPHSFADGMSPAVPDADGGMDGGPVPLPSDVPPPPEPDPDVTPADPYEEVTLNPAEECFGGDHVRRISEAFKNTTTGDYEVMRKRLTELGYPAPYIHRMPDHEGVPRARLDLRLFGGRLALEVTGSRSGGVIAEAFGASEREGVNVADVKRKPKSKSKPKPKQGAPAA